MARGGPEQLVEMGIDRLVFGWFLLHDDAPVDR
jgi:hypothetical protein